MSEVSTQCQSCGRRPALRRYCRSCSPQASILYKREQRRAAKLAGERYWLDWWVKAYGDDALAKRREHQRLYMRQYRRRGLRGRAA
jgi:hypothetical protein